MTKTAIALPLCLMAVLHAPVAKAGDLPAQRDIPADLSTVICPDADSARVMLTDYFALDTRGIFDTTRFFDGLKATRCEQASGPLMIREALARKQLRQREDGHYLAYRAQRPDGSSVFGIVDEALNGRFPRTAQAQWLALHAPSGRLINHNGGGKLYLCRSPEAAAGAIRAIPKLREPGVANPHQFRARDRAFAEAGCIMARGEFRITAVGRAIFVSTGYETGEEWTALEGLDAQGRKVGLIFDAWVM